MPLPRCLDCNKQLKDYRSTRCRSCNRKNTELSDDTKLKISNTLREKFRNLPNFIGFKIGHKINLGREYSAERNKKIKLSKLGKKRPPFSPGWLKNIGEATHKRHKEKIFGFKKGKENPSWNGGLSYKTHGYGIGFTGYLKRKIMERDGWACQLCNTYNKSLAIHHIDYNKKNCHKSNLITLCRSCNVKVNFHKEKWEKLFKNKIRDVYLSIHY